MPNGFGFGRGRGFGFGGGGRGWGMGYGFRGGMGFGFRGNSPPWPYVGLGRGGLPRHEYFLGGAAGAPAAWPYQQAPYPDYPGVAPFGAGQAPYPFYGGAAMGATPYAPQMTREDELDFLKSQAETIKGQLGQIESRVRDLETED